METDLRPLQTWIEAHPVVNRVRNLAHDAGIGCWLVGGAVRDPLLGREPKDADFIYVAPAGTEPGLPERLAEALGAPLVQYRKHLIIDRVVVEGRDYDFVRIPTPEALEADLRRRDFAWNAMALPLHELPLGTTLIDPLNGLDALRRCEVRFASEAAILEDPLRLLRAYRFALELGFAIPPETETLIRTHRARLSEPAGERVRDELLRMLAHPAAAATLLAMGEIGLLEVRFPALTLQRGVVQNDYHHLPVWEHTFECVRQLELTLAELPEELREYAAELEALLAEPLTPGRSRVALMKLALLFHDLGKPGTWARRADGQVTFLGHDKLSMELQRPYCNDLKLSTKEIGYLDDLVGQHLRPGFLDLDAPRLAKHLHKYFRDLGDSGVDLALISIADRLAAQGVKIEPHHNARHLAIIARIFHGWWRESATLRPPDLINGEDLMQAFDLKPGPKIGELLTAIKEAQVEGEVTNRDQALEYARGLLAAS